MFHFQSLVSIIAFGLVKDVNAANPTVSPSLVPTYFPTKKTDVIPGRFCATFDSRMTGGAAGYFGIEIQNNTGFVWYHLDMANVTTTCDLKQGLKYHLHTAWSGYGALTSSSSCAAASGHYDPDLACGPSSTEWNSLCNIAGRKNAYTCNPSIYGSGQYHACEVGDLSGKLGTAEASGPKMKTFRTDHNSDPLVDFTPPYLSNFGVGSAYLKPWASVVFHCAAPGNGLPPLVCAKLVRATEGSPCAQMPHKPYAFDPNYLSAKQKNDIVNNNNTAIALIVISVGVIFLIYIYLYIQFRAQQALEAKERAEVASAAATAGAAGGGGALELKPLGQAAAHH